MIAQPKLYSLPYTQMQTYVAASLFVIGNILLPQLFHLLPDGGKIWLPIYFFTLVGAYKYGWRVGLLTAVASPLINSWLFGMPAAAVLPAILLKSVLLAIAAGVVSARSGKVTLLTTALVVLIYQAIGALGEWALTSSLDVALQDMRIALPGMALQIFGATAVLRLWRK
ncbi:MAG: ECF transporter S component [Muribaculaceae bacterium]